LIKGTHILINSRGTQLIIENPITAACFGMYEVTFKLYTIICREKYKSYMRNTQTGTGKSSVSREVILLLGKKVNMNMCLILNGYRDRTVRIYKYKNIVNGNKQ